jgi:hypothetical protein
MPGQMIVMINRVFYVSVDEELHMRKSQFTDSQTMAALKKVETVVKVPDLCCEHGISSAEFFN